jgi:hypothetical protein
MLRINDCRNPRTGGERGDRQQTRLRENTPTDVARPRGCPAGRGGGAAAETMVSVPLYTRVLGDAWTQLAQPVRCMHRGHSLVRARGHLRIEHGPHRLARFIARMLRLPRPSAASETELIVAIRANGEHWLRTFDGRHLDTGQYESAECDLVERFGALWGVWSVADPQWLFRFAGMPLANHPAVFACLGMVVGLYGILYFEVARVPERGWLIAAIGLTGKVIGPIGMSWLIWSGAWPPSAVVLCLTNDVIWWIPFGLYLRDAWPALR